MKEKISFLMFAVPLVLLAGTPLLFGAWYLFKVLVGPNLEDQQVALCAQHKSVNVFRHPIQRSTDDKSMDGGDAIIRYKVWLGVSPPYIQETYECRFQGDSTYMTAIKRSV